jgi:hypothetical protein
MPQEEDDDAVNRERSARNNLTWTDLMWCIFHLGCLAMDAVAFRRIIDWQTDTSFLMGGHSQYLATWSIVASLACHISSLHAMLSFQPYPDTYVHRERRRRDRIYGLTARLSSLATIFCATSSVCHVALYIFGDLEWQGDFNSNRVGMFAPLHVMAFISLDKFICLVFQEPRHWSYGPSRFILRRTMIMELTIGQTGAHKAVSVYLTWLLACRIYNGRWGYTLLQALERGAGTGVSHFVQMFLLFWNVQLAVWVCWRFAAAIARQPRHL